VRSRQERATAQLPISCAPSCGWGCRQHCVHRWHSIRDAPRHRLRRADEHRPKGLLTRSVSSTPVHRQLVLNAIDTSVWEAPGQQGAPHHKSRGLRAHSVQKRDESASTGLHASRSARLRTIAHDPCRVPCRARAHDPQLGQTRASAPASAYHQPAKCQD